MRLFESTDYPEPLHSALGIEMPPPKLSRAPRAVPAPQAVFRIDRLIRHNRLEAARLADAELLRLTRHLQGLKRIPRKTAAAFISTLAAWGSTRDELELEVHARAAYFGAMAMSSCLGETCSSFYASTVQRAYLYIAPSFGSFPNSALEHALALHMAAGDDDVHVSGCLVDLARFLMGETEHKDYRYARGVLRTALERMPETTSPSRRFDAVELLARIHCFEGRQARAQALLETVEVGTLSLPARHAHTVLRAHMLRIGRKNVRRVFALLLEAAETASEVCGPETLLEDLVRAAELEPPLGGKIGGEHRDRWNALLEQLIKVYDGARGWAELVEELRPRRLARKALDPKAAKALKSRLLQLQQQELKATDDETVH